MPKFLIAMATAGLFAFAFGSAISGFATGAHAAGSRYCNIESCLKSCNARGGSTKGCPNYCNMKSREASAAGKCKS